VKVIDASSLAKYLLREAHWEQVRAQLATEPCSLDLAIAEVTTTIWKHHVVYGRISRDAAARMLDALERLKADVVRFEPSSEYVEATLKIACNARLPVYDAFYFAQARHHLAPLVTSDDRQRLLATKLRISVEFVG
jgi:predicted nucleic acid-binding protein